jgi:hypothetical protein
LPTIIEGNKHESIRGGLIKGKQAKARSAAMNELAWVLKNAGNFADMLVMGRESGSECFLVIMVEALKWAEWGMIGKCCQLLLQGLGQGPKMPQLPWAL